MYVFSYVKDRVVKINRNKKDNKTSPAMSAVTPNDKVYSRGTLNILNTINPIPMHINENPTSLVREKMRLTR